MAEESIGISYDIERDEAPRAAVNVAISLHQLYVAAARKWPGRELTQKYDWDGYVFRVDVSPYPAEVEEMLRKARAA